MAKAVLITGARSAAALDLARDFDSRLARWSKIDAKHHRIPPPRQEGAAFRASIKDLINTYEINLIVPTCEEVFHLAVTDLRDNLGGRLFTPDLATLTLLHDKFAFSQTAQAAGLAVPETRAIASDADLAVFKPRFGRFGSHTVIAPAPSELAHISPSEHDPWLAQACIRGREVCLYAVANHGKILGFSAYTSEWRLKGGASYVFEPLDFELSQALRKIAEKLANSAKIHGQFGLDVILDEKNTPFLIECNPRATSGVHLLSGQGHLARAIGEGCPIPDRAAATPSAYLGPALVGFGLPHALATGRFGAWRKCLANGHDAISRPGDRLPFAGAIADTIAFALKGLQHSISTNAATTYDIEWNGEELTR